MPVCCGRSGGVSNPRSFMNFHPPTPVAPRRALFPTCGGRSSCPGAFLGLSRLATAFIKFGLTSGLTSQWPARYGNGSRED